MKSKSRREMSEMGVNVAAYVEKFNEETKEWGLVTQEPISTRLKYVIDDYDELPRIQHKELSKEMQGKFKPDADGNQYASFHVTDLEALEEKVSNDVRSAYVKINTIIKALGVRPIYRDDGEESVWYDEDGEKEKLTFPINKALLEDLQYAISDLRKMGQREAFDLLLSEHIGYETKYRVVLVVC